MTRSIWTSSESSGLLSLAFTAFARTRTSRADVRAEMGHFVGFLFLRILSVHDGVNYGRQHLLIFTGMVKEWRCGTPPLVSLSRLFKESPSPHLGRSYLTHPSVWQLPAQV